jgi:DNA-binding GntR family transcriptional regulator
MRKIDRFHGAAAYRQVADDIEQRIADGEITCRLPAERALAEQYEVAYQTVRKSMVELRAREVIITRQGRGTFVAAALPSAANSTADDPPADDPQAEALSAG